MEHTAAVYLMDKAGRFVSALDYHERHDAKLAKLTSASSARPPRASDFYTDAYPAALR